MRLRRCCLLREDCRRAPDALPGGSFFDGAADLPEVLPKAVLRIAPALCQIFRKAQLFAKTPAFGRPQRLIALDRANGCRGGNDVGKAIPRQEQYAVCIGNHEIVRDDEMRTDEGTY